MSKVLTRLYSMGEATYFGYAASVAPTLYCFHAMLCISMAILVIANMCYRWTKDLEQ